MFRIGSGANFLSLSLPQHTFYERPGAENTLVGRPALRPRLRAFRISSPPALRCSPPPSRLRPGHFTPSPMNSRYAFRALPSVAAPRLEDRSPFDTAGDHVM